MVTPAASSDRWVRVGGPGVRGTAEWRGPVAPSIGAEVDVELAFDADVDWADVILDPRQAESVDTVRGELILDGLVMDVDHYGVLTLQLDGGIVLIDTIGDSPIGIEGRRVRLSVKGTGVFPSNV